MMPTGVKRMRAAESEPVTLETLAGDRQRALLNEVLPLQSAAHITLRRSADLVLLLADFSYLADFPRLATLHLYYEGDDAPPDAPLSIGANLHHSAVTDFGVHSRAHVLRGIAYFAGARLRALTLACAVQVDEAVIFPVVWRLTLARAYDAPRATFPSLQQLTLTDFDASHLAAARFPSAPTLVVRACSSSELMSVLRPYRAAVRHLTIEDVSGAAAAGDLIIDTSFAALHTLTVRRSSFRAARFALSSTAGGPPAFEHLTEITLDGTRPGVHPASPDMARYMPTMLERVSRLTLADQPHFWLGALSLPELELYAGPYTIPPAAVLESRAMDLDAFLLSGRVTPWQTLLMHRLRIHNPDVLLLSSVNHPFDIVRRAAPPYFRKAVPADPAAFFASRANECAICHLPFDRAEHEAEAAADIESNAFFDDPYDLIDATATSCVVNCNEARDNVHATHVSHRTCLSLWLFKSAPTYLCPYQQPLD